MSDDTDWERRWIKACRTIGELEQENERLREALEPFAKAADAYDPDEGDDLHLAWALQFTIYSLRAARAALEDKT